MTISDRLAAALSGLAAPVCAYVYDTEVLRARAARLHAAMPGVRVLYAVKANGHPDVVATLAAATDGLDVASGGELALAETALAEPASIDPGERRVVFSGPAKTDAELAQALRLAGTAGWRVTVNVESPHELRRLDALARAAETVAEVALRVNRADAGLPGSHAMTGAPTPFGVDAGQLGDVVRLAQDLAGVRLIGWHLHAVSNNLDPRAHGAFAATALSWSMRTARQLGVPLSYVNLGGGFGVDYTSTAEFDPGGLRVRPPAGVEVMVEPGRWLVADAGWYAAEVLDLKQTHGRWFAVLRGGTHHFRLPAAWGYSHPFAVLPVERWSYPWPRPQVDDVEVDAVGELCTPRDVLTRGQRVDRLRVGDVLVFARAGGYGWDISHHDYLRHPEPAFVVL